MKPLFILLILPLLAFGQAPQWIPTPIPGDPIRLSSPPTFGSGAPSNPCPKAGASYIDTVGLQLYACATAGGNWFLTGNGAAGPPGPVGSSATATLTSSGAANQTLTITHNFGTIIHQTPGCTDQTGSSPYPEVTGFLLAPGINSDVLTFPVSGSGQVIVCDETSGGGGGSGTVNSGSANSLGYYSATGTAVSPLTPCNSGILQYSASGIPSCSATVPGVPTLSALQASGFSNGATVMMGGYYALGDISPYSAIYAITTGACSAPDGGSQITLNNGNCATYASRPTTVTPKMFGALGDGTGAALSAKFGSLGAAQAVYGIATSLAQSIDYVAIKSMSNYSLGPDGSEHGTGSSTLNIPMFFPNGTYNLGANQWFIRNAAGANIQGANYLSTFLEGSNANGVFATDGFWYSTFGNMKVQQLNSSALTVMDIDGDVVADPLGAGFGVQQDTYPNLALAGDNGSYDFTLCYAGSVCEGATQVFINPHWNSAATALYFSTGYNALNNLFLGGDMSVYPMYAILIQNGSVTVSGTTFESTIGWQQIINGGCDVHSTAGGTNQSITLIGLRSENFCVANTGSAQQLDLLGVTQDPAAFGTWTAMATFNTPNLQMVRGTDANGTVHPYLSTGTNPCTTGGTIPTWPVTGTVTDGTCTWTEKDYTAVTASTGAIDAASYIDPTSRPANISFGTIAAGTPYGLVDGNQAGNTASLSASSPTAEAFVDVNTARATFCATDQATAQPLPGSGLTCPPQGASLLGGSASTLNIGSGNTIWLSMNRYNDVLIGPTHGSQPLWASANAPTVSGGLGTSPVVNYNNGTLSFEITVGSSPSTSSATIVLQGTTVNADGWACKLEDVTNNATHDIHESASASTSITITDYARTTGVAQTFTAADKIVGMCAAF